MSTSTLSLDQAMNHYYYYYYTLLLLIATVIASEASIPKCRSYCGNLTVDYPFAIAPGCGHPAFRNLLFCVNDVLMLHLPSGSYRLLNLDYSFHSLTLHDPFLSTCSSLFLRRPPATPTAAPTTITTPNGLVVPPSLSPFLTPSSDTIFLLLHCSPLSPLFQGFPSQHLPCRNVSGMGCRDYFACPAWHGNARGVGEEGERCCGVAFEAIREVNLSKLECGGYSSAYSVAPIKVGEGAKEWSYGIRMLYSVPAGDYAFCRSCEATGGTCGYKEERGEGKAVCMCGSRNSTSNCDSANSTGRLHLPTFEALTGLLTCIIIVWMAIL
ncbi:hypothetical protein Sjap_023558 [Stephania japonica]|uniref:Wall-associated receptor kinase galacturonan-binding domain-containing protein n=1 Tax=Stephania japonica TaxID=461633 RepID=A0AAP0EBT7_9MAGN